MIKHVLALVLGVTVAFTVIGRAQEPAPSRGGPQRPQVALKVHIVISRFQGEKKVSSIPYTLSVNTGVRSSLRMGSDVPIPSTTTKDGVTTSSFSYKLIGTNIDCFGSIIDDVHYQLSINIDDSSVYSESQLTGIPKTNDLTPFRHFSASENVILRDGQTTELTVATDKFTGEVIKADVTLSVVK